MFVDSDGPSQEAFQYISERGFLVPEEKFISEEVFLTDEFNPTMPHSSMMYLIATDLLNSSTLTNSTNEQRIETRWSSLADLILFK